MKIKIIVNFLFYLLLEKNYKERCYYKYASIFNGVSYYKNFFY